MPDLTTIPAAAFFMSRVAPEVAERQLNAASTFAKPTVVAPKPAAPSSSDQARLAANVGPATARFAAGLKLPGRTNRK